ncbi:MAG: hypothetical protein WC852_06425 [Candidatus Nanoarchaeia archaeon]|jgi:hypothetical protein
MNPVETYLEMHLEIGNRNIRSRELGSIIRPFVPAPDEWEHLYDTTNKLSLLSLVADYGCNNIIAVPESAYLQKPISELYGGFHNSLQSFHVFRKNGSQKQEKPAKLKPMWGNIPCGILSTAEIISLDFDDSSDSETSVIREHKDSYKLVADTESECSYTPDAFKPKELPEILAKHWDEIISRDVPPADEWECSQYMRNVSVEFLEKMAKKDDAWKQIRLVPVTEQSLLGFGIQGNTEYARANSSPKLGPWHDIEHGNSCHYLIFWRKKEPVDEELLQRQKKFILVGDMW